MSRRTFIQSKEKKCNFCQNWFQSSCKQNCVHICPKCISIYSDLIMVHFPDDQFIKYVRNGPLHQPEQIRVEDTFLISDSDPQVKLSNQKWTQTVNKMRNGPRKQFSKLRNVLDEFILMREIDSQSEKSFTIDDSNETDSIASQSILGVEPEKNKENKRINQKPSKGISMKKILNDKISNINLIKNTKKGSCDVIPCQNQKDTQLKQKNLNKIKRKDRNQIKKYRSPFAKTQKDYNLPIHKKFREHDATRTQQLGSTRKSKQILLQSKDLKQRISEYLQKDKQIPPTKILEMTNLIHDAIILKTQHTQDHIALCGQNINCLDIKCYLNVQTWSGIKKLRLIDVELNDRNFRLVLDFIKDKEINTLNLTRNQITDQSLYCLLNEIINFPFLKHVYLSNNFINPKIISTWNRMKTDNFTIHF